MKKRILSSMALLCALFTGVSAQAQPTYCTPSGACNGYFMNDFYTSNGITNISNMGSDCTRGYVTGQTLTQAQGGVVYFGFTVSQFQLVRIYVDWNQNGVFTDGGELIYSSNNYSPTTANGALTVPGAAALGTTRMRVVTSFQTSINSCTASSGDYEDYDFVVTQACTGTPAAGTATLTSGSTPIYGSGNITLSLSGNTSAPDIALQWQSSADSGVNWSNIAGATAATYSATGLSTSTLYRAKVTCVTSAQTSYSNGVYIKVVPIYCTPTGTCGSYYINDFSTANGTTNISNLNSGCTRGYVSGQTVTRAQGSSIDFSFNLSQSQTARIYVDWNQDKDFADAGEEVFSTGSNYSPLANSGSITVPTTSATGTTIMRVITSSQTSINSCISTEGDYEDYDFTVVAACVGAPAAGTAAITSGSTPLYGGGDVTLSLSGYTSSTQVTLQWQSSADSGVNWSNVAGATAATYAANGIVATTSYRAKVTCLTSSQVSYSNMIYIQVIPVYCTPAGSGNCGGDFLITGFYTTSGSTNISNLNSGCTRGYVPGQTVTKTQGGVISYGFTLNRGQTIRVYVDWNQDKDFLDGGELIYSSGSQYAATTGGSSVAVPANAVPGTSRIRILSSFQSSINSCNAQLGDYEDYDFVILAACTGAPAAGTAALTSGSTAKCPGSSASFASTGYTSATDVTLQWQSSANGTTWSDITGATTATYTATNLTASASYRMKATCTASSQASYTNAVAITVGTVTSTATIQAPATLCYLAQATFTVAGTNLGTAPTYAWYRNGILIPDTTGPQYITSNISKYAPEALSVIVSHINTACTTDTILTATDTVQALNPLDPNTTYTTVSTSTKLCEGDAATFTSKSALAPGAQFSWAVNGAIALGATSSSYTTAQAGVVTATVTSAEGCVRSADRTIYALPLAEAVATGDPNICPGASVTLEATPVAGASYRWKLDGTSRGTASTQVAQSAGNYTVTVTRNSCAATSAPIAIIVRTPVTTITPATPMTVCTPNTIVLQAEQSPDYTYQWYRSSTLLTGETASSLNATTSGSYKVAISSGGCAAKTSGSTTATINVTPVATITRIVNGYAYNTLRATATGTGTTYQWYKNDAVITGATTRDYVATTSGGYSVAASKSGCTAYSDVPFQVMLGNGAKLDEVITTDEATLISVYPNPSEGIFYIGSQEAVNVMVKDVQGRTIISESNASQVDLSAQAAGMYLLLITDAKGNLLKTERLMRK